MDINYDFVTYTKFITEHDAASMSLCPASQFSCHLLFIRFDPNIMTLRLQFAIIFGVSERGVLVANGSFNWKLLL